MAIKIGIILLFVLCIALAGLFFVVAGFLFFAPESLIGTLRTGMAISCVAGGAILLVPILIFACCISAVCYSMPKKRKTLQHQMRKYRKDKEALYGK